MEILNASDAKREFGELLLKSQQEPIGINKNGKPVAVVISTKEFEQFELLKEYRLKMLLQEGIDDFKSGKTSDGKDVLERLRQRI